MNTLYTKREAKKEKRFLIIGILAVMVLAFIVQKELEIPSWILYPMAGLGLVFLLFRSLKTPLPAYYALVCYVPFSKVIVGDFGSGVQAVNLTNILMFLVFVGICTRSVAKGTFPFQRNSLNVPIVIFCCFSVFSLIRGNFLFGHWYSSAEFLVELKRWLTPIFMFYLAYNALEDKGSIKNSIKIMMLVVFIAGAMATWDYANISSTTSLEKARIGGITTKSNQLAAFFVYYMFLFAGFILTNLNKPRYWALIIPFLVAFRGIMVTFSRGGYLGFGFALAAITFFRNKLMFVLLISLMVFVYTNPWMLPKGIQYRMSQTVETAGGIYNPIDFEESLENSSKRRIQIWKAGLVMIKEQPWIGFGYGSFPLLIGRYDPRVRGFDAHNTYIILAAEMGLPALFSFLFILLILFKESHWVYRRAKDTFFSSAALGALGGLSGLIMINMFGSRLNTLEVSGYLWILAALILKMKYLEKKETVKQVPQKKTKVKHFSKGLTNISGDPKKYKSHLLDEEA